LRHYSSKIKNLESQHQFDPEKKLEFQIQLELKQQFLFISVVKVLVFQVFVLMAMMFLLVTQLPRSTWMMPEAD
jgi:hypothetical protein